MPQTLLIETLQKSKKNLEDAQLIYEHIRSFRFFENFFAQNLRTMDHSGILALCKEFGHEHIPIGRFVFQKGDPSNNKFYVILSGKIGIVIPRKDSVVSPRRPSIRKSILKHNYKKLSMEPTPIKSPSDRSQSPEELDRQRSIIVNDSRRTTFFASQSESESNKSGFNINLVKVPEGHSEKSSSPLKQARSPRRSKTFQGMITSMASKKEKESEQETENETPNPIVPMIPMEIIQRETPDILSPHDEEEDEDDTQPVDYNELQDKAKFEDYASRFGVLVRYMGPGESFGELALKNNVPRSASVLCSDDCEFLVITKQQFEQIFEKKDREKEEFLKSTFPFLNSMSTFIANYVLLSFKTEVIKKGTYLAREGRVAAEDSKFHLIHKGECLIEKVVSVQLNSPLNKTKFVAKDSQTAQISIVGQGTIAGEEILINKDRYNYSVKTLSDGVLVHSVAKKDFESIFFKDFHEHLISMYLKKKKQRDIIFENVRKDHEAKTDELKAKNIYSVQNTKMGNVLSTPALQSLSRYMHREQNNMSNNTPVNANGQLPITSPKNSTYQPDSFGGFMASRNMANEEDSFQIDPQTLEKKKFPKIIDLRDSTRQGVAQRLEYLNKVADSPKRRDSPAEIADFSSIKLFETESSKNRKNIRKPSMFGGESPANRGSGGAGNDVEKDSPPPSTVKEAAMRTRIKPLSIVMPEHPEHDEEPSPLLKLNMPISPIASLVKVGGNGGNTESKQTTIPELSLPKSIGGHLGAHDINNRHNSYAVLIGNNGNISGKYQYQNQIKVFVKPQEGSSFGAMKAGRVALPQLKTLNLDKIGQGKKKDDNDDENSFDEFEPSTKGQTTYMNGTTDRPTYLSSRFGEKLSPGKMSPEIKSAKGVFSFQSELGNMLKGYRAQHSVRLKVTQDWRSKVFQKTSGPNNHHHKRIASEGVNFTAKLGVICSPIGTGKAAKTKNQASKAK